MESNLLDVVHSGDGSLSIGVTAISDKTEAAATTSVTVLDDDLCELCQLDVMK